MLSWLTSTTLGRIVATFVISMFPIVELRAGIPYGIGTGLEPWQAFLAAALGNLLPIPFILLLLDSVMNWLKTKKGFFGKVANFLENKAEKNRATVEKYKALGLIVLVAVPLPGTGAWTGALVATALRLEKKMSFLCIVIGVMIAGAVMLAVSCGVAAAV